MNWIDNSIALGDMVIRAYAWETDEFGLVVDVKPWRDTIEPPEGEDAWEKDEYAAMDGIEVFTVLWPTGFMTTEMDVELYSFEYFCKVVIDQPHEDFVVP